jgi:hypothetical protein
MSSSEDTLLFLQIFEVVAYQFHENISEMLKLVQTSSTNQQYYRMVLQITSFLTDDELLMLALVLRPFLAVLALYSSQISPWRAR